MSPATNEAARTTATPTYAGLPVTRLTYADTTVKAKLLSRKYGYSKPGISLSVDIGRLPVSWIVSTAAAASAT